MLLGHFWEKFTYEKRRKLIESNNVISFLHIFFYFTLMSSHSYVDEELLNGSIEKADQP